MSACSDCGNSILANESGFVDNDGLCDECARGGRGSYPDHTNGGLSRFRTKRLVPPSGNVFSTAPATQSGVSKSAIPFIHCGQIIAADVDA